MSRSKSSTQIKEPASLPDVLIPPSQVDAKDRDAYWIQLAANVEEFCAAIKTEEFWSLLAQFPEALWGDTLRLYLYRKKSDDGVMVKNAPGDWNYQQVFYKPIDQQWIADKFGGGKYELRLNWVKDKHNETIKKFTFDIWGDPKVKPGQTVEVDGKPVPLAIPGVTAAAPGQPSEAAQLMETSKHASESAMSTLMTAAKTSIEMVREQAAAQATPPPQVDLLTTIKTVAEIMRPQQPQGNSMKDALEIVNQLDAMAARRNPPQPQEQPETPIEQTLSAVEKLTGGVSLPELLKPHTRSAPPDSISPWVPMAEAAAKLVANLIDKYPVIQQQQNERLRLEIHLRSMGQPGQPQLAPPPPPPLGPTIVQPQGPPRPPVNPPIAPAAAAPQPPDQGQLMNAVVQMVIAGFQRQPIGSWGKETATAIDFHFGELIDSMGIGSFLGDEAQVREFIAGHPELNQLSKSDARFFSMFLPDFLEYTVEERWGAPQSSEGEQENGHPPIEMPSVSRTALPTA